MEGFPLSHVKNVLLVVVDCFSKYVHFIPLSHPYTATMVSHRFFDYVFKLHRLPESSINDADVIFTSIFDFCGTKLACTSAYHL